MCRKCILWFRWLNGICFLAMLGLNGYANFFSLGGRQTGDVSKAYPNLFTPADGAFAIWGAIYLLLAGFVLWQTGWLPGTKQPSAKAVQRIGGWFVLSCLLNMLWLLCWHYDWIALSVWMIFLLLAALAVLTGRIRTMEDTWMEKLFLRAAFSLYFGWITMAAVTDVCVWLVKLRWDGWGLSGQSWMVIVLLLGMLAAGITVLRRRDWVYGAAVVWAYGGILWKHVSAKGFSMAYPAAAVTAALAGLGVALAAGKVLGLRGRLAQGARK